MGKSAKLAVYADHTRNTISKNIFGHFMEHSVDVIYGSVFDPESLLADEDGFRRDVLEALRDAKVPMLRYPGGNFVSNYHWEDGIGPREKRPKCFDYAWLAEDDNRMGTVEFIKLCRKTGAEPYLCVNMGSGTAEEAMHWVEFCNGTGNTRYAALRKSLGYEEPFHVKYWGLGNELYGDWQFGAMNASDYAKKALDFAKAMKWMDPEIELVACGYDLGSDWNYEVARVLKPLIGHLAIHHYSIGYGIFTDEDYRQCMYIPDYITKLTNAARASVVAGTNDALSEIKIAWDEWNTHAWDLEKKDDDRNYTLRNAVLTAGILHSFIRSSDIVEIAGYSPFVNVCGAISVKKDRVLKRPQYYVFELLSKVFGECTEYVETRLECDTCSMPEVIDYSNRPAEAKFALNAKTTVRYVETGYLDCAASMNRERSRLALSLINKSEDRDYTVDVSVFGSSAVWKDAVGYELYHPDFDAANTVQDPEQVVIREAHPVSEEGKIYLKRHSLTVVVMNLLQGEESWTEKKQD